MAKTSFLIMLLNSFPEAMLVGLLGLSILGFRPGLKQILCIGFFEAAISYFIISLPIPFGVHTFLQFITFSLVIYFVMFIPYKISFLAALLGLSIYLSVEAVLMPLSLNLTGFPITKVLNNFWLRQAFFLTQALVTILVIILVKRYNAKLTEYRNLFFKPDASDQTNRSYTINKSFILIWFFLAQNFLVALLFIINYNWVRNRQIPNVLASVSVPVYLIAAVLPVIAILMIKRVIELIRDEIETKTRLDALRHVEELLHTIRAQRHDFSHELQVAYGLLEVEAFQEAREYIKNSMAEIASTSELIKTDNLGITALLQTKSGMAEAKKIKLSIQVETSLRDLPLESRDANIILGNLIDNALEAVMELPPAQREVQVILAQDVATYVFEVKNCGRIIPELTGKIFAPGFSTKKEGRGMGLYSVDRLVKKHNGKIEVDSSEGYTVFKVYVPAKR